MRSIAAKEDPPITEAIGDHAPSSPIPPTENREPERGSHAQDLSDATVEISL